MQNIFIQKFNNVSKFGNLKQQKQQRFISAPDQREQDSFEKKGLSKKQKIGIGVGVGIALLTAGAVIANAITKKKVNTKTIKETSTELKTIFEELRGETGENFINRAYSKLKTYMKLDGIAPEKIGKMGGDNAFSIQGGFNPALNVIEFTDGFYTKMSKAQQFEMLAHELKHSEQCSKILRSGMLDKYTSALAHSAIENVKNDPLNIPFKMAYQNAVKKGEGEAFLKKMHKQAKKSIKTEVSTNHKNTLKMPKFEPGSPEYLDAEKYVEATENYTGLGMFGVPTEGYRNNLLEEEAYSWGRELANKFKAYLGKE